jgi:CBS domain-containing protein
MNVADVMTRGVISLAPDDSVQKAAKLMVQYEVSGFPVLDHGKLVGIVTEGDFLRRVETGTEQRRTRWIEFLAGPGQLADEYAHAHGRKVGDVMTRDLVTVTEETSLEELVGLMESHHIKRLPVVKGGDLVGIISRGTLLHAFLAAWPKPTTRAMSDASIREQLAAEFNRQSWAPSGSLDVAVKNGIVDLHGIIRDERQRAALRIAAENIPGVKLVRDHLTDVVPLQQF